MERGRQVDSETEHETSLCQLGEKSCKELTLTFAHDTPLLATNIGVGMLRTPAPAGPDCCRSEGRGDGRGGGGSIAVGEALLVRRFFSAGAALLLPTASASERTAGELAGTAAVNNSIAV